MPTNPLAVKTMSEVGIDISKHIPTNVTAYLSDTWDYVITVCGSANETCPAFEGNVGKRLHIGFDDPSEAIGTTDFIKSEFELSIHNKCQPGQTVWLPYD